MPMENSANHKNKTLFLLLLVCLLPVLLGWIMYYFSAYFHFNQSSHGTLLNPPVQVNEWVSQQKQSRQWQIVLSVYDCDQSPTSKVAFKLSQMHKALGEDQKRVNLAVWTLAACEISAPKRFDILVFKQNAYNELQRRLKQRQADGMNKIYLIDPLGNLFMYYPLETNPKDIYNDLKVVLGVSRIG